MAQVATPKWLAEIAKKNNFHIGVYSCDTKEYGSDYMVEFNSLDFTQTAVGQAFFMNTLDDKEGLVVDMKSFLEGYDPQDEAQEYCREYEIEDADEFEDILNCMRANKFDYETIVRDIEQIIKNV